MELNDYQYAGKYVKDGMVYFRELRRLIGLSNKYYDNATNISAFKRMFSVSKRVGASDFMENSIVNMVDSKQLVEDAVHKCMDYCSVLNVLDDELGAEIIFYYYFLKCSIENISRCYLIARKTCYRHLYNALNELDEVLEIGLPQSDT